MLYLETCAYSVVFLFGCGFFPVICLLLNGFSVSYAFSVEFELKGRLQRALFREKQTCKSDLDGKCVSQQLWHGTDFKE